MKDGQDEYLEWFLLGSTAVGRSKILREFSKRASPIWIRLLFGKLSRSDTLLFGIFRLHRRFEDRKRYPSNVQQSTIKLHKSANAFRCIPPPSFFNRISHVKKLPLQSSRVHPSWVTRGNCDYRNSGWDVTSRGSAGPRSSTPSVLLEQRPAGHVGLSKLSKCEFKVPDCSF